MNFFDKITNRNKINFVEKFINAENEIEFLDQNDYLLNKLSKEEFKQIFLHSGIDYNIKNYIIKNYSNKVKKIDNSDFYIIMQLLSSRIDIFKYTDKLNKLNYQDYCKCLENIVSPECLLETVGTTKFLQLLREEEKNGKVILNYYSIFKDMYLASIRDNLVDFKNLSSKLLTILSIGNYEYVNINLISKIFFDYFNNNIEKFEIDDSAYKCAFEFMNYNIKNNLELNSDMLEFYTKYRVQNLNLQNFIRKVRINEKLGTNEVGFFNYLTRELSINISVLKKSLIEFFEKANVPPSRYINIINIEALFTISHEIGHARTWENYFSRTRCRLLADNYFIKSNELRDEINYEEYENNHENFITENRADLFAIMDLSVQIDKYLKNSFSESTLSLFMKTRAHSIIKMYTFEDGNKKIIKSPIQKFEDFLEKTSRNLTQSEKIIYSDNDYIMKKLVFGFPIPTEILTKIRLIATGVIKTTNIYETILEFINEYENTKEIKGKTKK